MQGWNDIYMMLEFCLTDMGVEFFPVEKREHEEVEDEEPFIAPPELRLPPSIETVFDQKHILVNKVNLNRQLHACSFLQSCLEFFWVSLDFQNHPVSFLRFAKFKKKI